MELSEPNTPKPIPEVTSRLPKDLVATKYSEEKLPLPTISLVPPLCEENSSFDLEA